jgi:hypothetical protein
MHSRNHGWASEDRDEKVEAGFIAKQPSPLRAITTANAQLKNELVVDWYHGQFARCIQQEPVR